MATASRSSLRSATKRLRLAPSTLVFYIDNWFALGQLTMKKLTRYVLFELTVAFLITLTGITVFAPIAWTHYYIILLVPLVSAVSRGACVLLLVQQ